MEYWVVHYSDTPLLHYSDPPRFPYRPRVAARRILGHTRVVKPRVRFAPSPTGFLHIGGARTALFNWLYARHTGGSFILRIEDTDAARNTQAAVNVILDGLRWLGLDWDEGPISADATGPSKGDCAPYFQSQRQDNYRRRVEALLSRGLAYESGGAIKFKMTREPITIPDLVVGDVRRDLTDREQVDPDFIIVRSDGQPVFHLVNVVDDLEMRITHVIRGEDHLSNTAKHIALFRAFGVEPPKYAHIPLILNIDGTKMSKRDKGASLTTYMEEGYAPEALVNYLCLLGWSPKNNREKMALKEVIESFDLPQILRHNARFDLTKLIWLNGEYIREMPDDRFYELSIHALGRVGLDTNKFPIAYVKAALDTCKGKFKLLGELPAYAGFYFKEDIAYDPDAAQKDFTPENKPRVAKLREALAKLKPFEPDPIGATLKAVAQELGVKAGVLVHPTRLACCGNTAGPSLYHLLAILGKDRTLQRIDRALERMG
jgi:glutamyl-tRNA synthetase